MLTGALNPPVGVRVIVEVPLALPVPAVVATVAAEAAMEKEPGLFTVMVLADEAGETA